MSKARLSILNLPDELAPPSPIDLSAFAGAIFHSEDDTVTFDRKRLAQYLHRLGHHFDPDAPIRQLSGGLANRNYLLFLDGVPVVLRRPPDGELPRGAHDMAREHFILSRLSAVLPFVPRGLHWCSDTAVIGAQFQLIEFRPGRVVRGGEMSAVLDEQDAPAQLSKMLVETLARIHSVDADAAGLSSLGRPAGFVSRAIDGWTERGLRVANPPIAALLRELHDWLEHHRFADRAPTFMHCDFKLDNVILAPDAIAPAAVVDWDMGTRGDPLFDLATTLSYWAEPGDPDCLRLLRQMPTASPGFWSRAEASSYYSELSGLALDDLPAMRVLAMLKLGVVFMQLHQQWTRGAVRDVRYSEFGSIGEQLLVLTREIAEGRAD